MEINGIEVKKTENGYWIPSNVEINEVKVTMYTVDGKYAKHTVRELEYDCAISAVCEVCGEPTQAKYITKCNACHKKFLDEKYLTMEEVEWDGETPLAIFDSDEYFWNEDGIICYCEDHDIDVKDLQLLLCEKEPLSIDVASYFDDYGEDTCDIDFKELQDFTDKWILDNVPALWYPTNKRVSIKI